MQPVLIARKLLYNFAKLSISLWPRLKSVLKLRAEPQWDLWIFPAIFQTNTISRPIYPCCKALRQSYHWHFVWVFFSKFAGSNLKGKTQWLIEYNVSDKWVFISVESETFSTPLRLESIELLHCTKQIPHTQWRLIRGGRGGPSSSAKLIKIKIVKHLKGYFFR